MKHRKKKILLFCSALLLLCIFAVAVYHLDQANREYRLQEQAYAKLDAYRPGRSASGSEHGGQSLSPSDFPKGGSSSGPAPGFLNAEILRLRKDHPNAVGWISVPDTGIEFPFVQGEDNEYFLRRDVDGAYLYAGVPFLDYRCAADCSGGNSIFYGHNLRNGSMFGPLEHFREQDYMTAHPEILIYLETHTVHAQIVACLVVDPGEKEYLYDLEPGPDHLRKLLSDARCIRQTEIPEAPRYITLSTCGYEFNGARIVIVGIVDETT